jgi:hypothetical protein
MRALFYRLRFVRAALARQARGARARENQDHAVAPYSCTLTPFAQHARERGLGPSRLRVRRARTRRWAGGQRLFVCESEPSVRGS